MLKLQDIIIRSADRYLLDAFNMQVEEGSLYGLVGAAGSGKTLVMRLCAGLLEPDNGNVIINNLPMDQKKNQKKRSSLIGYMAEKNGIYPNLRALEYLEFYAHAQGLYGLAARERCVELLQMADLERRAETVMENLSDSTQRMLEFLRTLIHRPSLLLLDNPFLGMDLQEKVLAKNIIAQLAVEGITVVVTMLSLQEALEYCDHVGILREGKLFAQGTREQLNKQLRSNAPIYMEIGGGKEQAIRLLQNHPQVRSFTYQNQYFVIQHAGNAREESALLRMLIMSDVQVISFQRGGNNLEDFI